MGKQKFLNYALIVVITLLLVQTFSGKPEAPTFTDDLVIVADAEITTGKTVSLRLLNNTDATMTFESNCPSEPFSVARYENGEWRPTTATTDVERCATEPLVLAAGEVIIIDYQPWQRALFGEVGKYRIEIPLGEKAFLHEFEVRPPGFFGTLWREIVYRPIYNTLAFFTKFSSYSFGLGIVLLTLLLRLLLFIPFQKSLKSQRRMQHIQPEIDAIKKQYEGNKQMIAMETMALMKKHKVNPLGSCLPILIQMPFLLALFWVTRDGLGESNFVYFYSFLSDFDFALVSTDFLGLDLTASGSQFYFALPLALAVFQFGQMKLALHHSHKNKKPTGDNPLADAMHSMTKIMPYALPVMIGFFSASLPAAVGVYWGVSTIFGIAQQLLVNRQIK